jgi:hypothetical protein
MPPTAASRDLAYTRALAAASQRMWAASDLAALWQTVVDEALALIAADGASVVRHTERFWQTLAARPSETAPDDSATAAVIEMLFRQGLLQQTHLDRRSGRRRLLECGGQTGITRGAD